MLELTQGKYIERSYLESIGKNSTKGYDIKQLSNCHSRYRAQAS